MKNLTCGMLGLLVTLSSAIAGFEVAENQGRIEISDGRKCVLGWQLLPLKEPKGGPVFSGNAFIHPLCTPSGFELTQIQPDDHLHHFGVWWPWKMLTIEGKNFNTWEIQERQGRHVAVKVDLTGATADEVKLSLQNRFEISRDGKIYQPVIEETVALRLSRSGKDAYVLDLDIHQKPVDGVAVSVTKYRYSGLSWRGTAGWNADNSVMRSSGGHHRDNANHQPANWLSVDGATPQGRATMLMMSAAAKQAGKPELLRVWGGETLNGAPFANFNPVVKESIALDGKQPAVSQRRYRLILADRAIDAAEADRLWKAWME